MTIDDLASYGMERMDDSAITQFLTNQRIGVLGLPGDGAPLMLPMSFGFDDESHLLFTFVLGESSEKQRLADRSEQATFLVFSVESAFNWESVSTTGTLTPVPETEWEDYAEILDSAWRPSLFESATADGDVAVYRFQITDWVGVRHTGLPPGFEEHQA
jgi:nitroimidazol reductase NimA-like FMN-containing flavoprotein (pyridoxamine 5'-phosphate oxidase superfamily)